MKLLAFSDLHRDLGQAAQLVERASDVDVVIAAGDFASVHEGLAGDHRRAEADLRADDPRPGQQRDRGRPARRVRGLGAPQPSCTARAPRSTATQFYGLGAGIPITPWDWSFDLDEEQAAEQLAGCPDGAVLVVHSPPKGHCDQSSAGDHLGSTAILEAIEAKRPQLAVCGHIHESWGAQDEIGPTRVINLGPAGTAIELAS